MTIDNWQDDDVLAGVAGLKSFDVSARRTERLRDRCHARLRGQPWQEAAADVPSGSLFRRVIGPALGGAWCLAYLVEVIRRAAAVYGF
jgi:hypothetical protein